MLKTEPATDQNTDTQITDPEMFMQYAPHSLNKQSIDQSQRNLTFKH